jgi:ribonuclease HI
MHKKISPDANVRRAIQKRFRTALARKSVGGVCQVANFLLRLERSGLPYPDCLSLLEAAFRDTLGALSSVRLGTDDSRRYRAYAEEAFHLVRDELQVLRGRPVSKAPCFSVGDPGYDVTAHIDGSVRNGKAAIGVFLKVGRKHIVTAAIAVEATNSAEAEMQALLVAMKTALALDRRHLRVMTDAEALIVLLHRKSRLRYTRTGRQVLEVASLFSGLHVVVVPRIFNHRADRIALQRTRILAPAGVGE